MPASLINRLRPHAKKKKMPPSSAQELSGLVPGWKKTKAQASQVQANLSRAPSTASTRTSISRRASSTVPTDHEDTRAIASDGDPAFIYGGFLSDEDEIEHPGVQSGASLTNKYRVRALFCSHVGHS
jgi:hypothetical protein